MHIRIRTHGNDMVITNGANADIPAVKYCWSLALRSDHIEYRIYDMNIQYITYIIRYTYQCTSYKGCKALQCCKALEDFACFWHRLRPAATAAAKASQRAQQHRAHMPVIEVIAQYKPTMLTLSQKSAIAACFGLATDDYSPHKRSPSV